MAVAIAPNVASELSLALQVDASELSAELASWLERCPNVERFADIIRECAWLNQDSCCAQCSEEYVRKDLRFDESTPCGNIDNLICRECWELFSDGTVWNPSYRPPHWIRSLAQWKDTTGGAILQPRSPCLAILTKQSQEVCCPTGQLSRMMEH